MQIVEGGRVGAVAVGAGDQFPPLSGEDGVGEHLPNAQRGVLGAGGRPRARFRRGDRDVRSSRRRRSDASRPRGQMLAVVADGRRRTRARVSGVHSSTSRGSGRPRGCSRPVANHAVRGSRADGPRQPVAGHRARAPARLRLLRECRLCRGQRIQTFRPAGRRPRSAHHACPCTSARCRCYQVRESKSPLTQPMWRAADLRSESLPPLRVVLSKLPTITSNSRASSASAMRRTVVPDSGILFG